MNRLALAEEIARRVPMLAQRDQDEWKHAEQLRSKFVADYALKRISSLSLDQYVIGKGAENRSFCYRLEREMDTLGKIVGATALKFGVYFGRTKSDAEDRYRFASHWGDSLDEAFQTVKQAIVDLLQAAAFDNHTAIASNQLSPMLKGKILFVYHPNKFAPIYSEAHLEHFISALDLRGPFQCGADMQRALMDYRTTWPELLEQPPALYMRLLYDVFGYPPELESSQDDATRAPLLDVALNGAQFISAMPPSPVNPKHAPATQGKRDFDKQQRALRRIGDRGEALVLALEKRRLTNAGTPELAAQIKHVSQENDSAGYDILSFESDGTTRPIEVKATTSSNLDRGFYITRNEVETAGALPNYHVYLVFSAMSKQPRVLPVRQPLFNGVDFLLQPVSYHVTLGAPPFP